MKRALGCAGLALLVGAVGISQAEVRGTATAGYDNTEKTSDPRAKLSAEIIADPETRQIRADLKTALVAGGKGQFEGTVKQLSERNLRLGATVAARLGIDVASLPKGAQARSATMASRLKSRGTALKSAIVPGLVAATAPINIPVSVRVWTASADSFASLEKLGKGTCKEDLEDPGSQASGPARVSAAIIAPEFDPYTSMSGSAAFCEKSRWRYTTVAVPATHDSVGNPTKMRVVAQIPTMSHRITSGGYVQYSLRVDGFGTCYSKEAKSGTEEFYSENITVDCEVPLAGKSGNIKIGPEVIVGGASGLDYSSPGGVGLPAAAMADFSLQKIDVQVTYSGK
jgi:hypothetical protein